MTYFDQYDNPPGNYTDPIWAARRDHAVWLRERGVTYQEIAERLGITRERPRQMVAKRERQLLAERLGWRASGDRP